jgi:hypothetical protein
MEKPNVGKVYNSVMSGTEGMYEDVIAAMEEYGKQMFNYAIELAARNAEAQLGGLESNPNCEVDKQSILKLKL